MNAIDAFIEAEKTTHSVAFLCRATGPSAVQPDGAPARDELAKRPP